MKFFVLLRINIKNGKLKQIRVFEIPILEYGIKNQKKIRPRCPLFYQFKFDNKKPVFYLKINRDTDYTYLCLQHWIDTLDYLDRDFYILCDRQKLEKNVLRKITFYNTNIKFIKSCKNSALKKIVDKIATKWWFNATFAHLTTFFHARQNKINKFWNIDADDTMFALEPQEIGNLLKNVEKYAAKEDIKTLSLDMWHSRTRKKHWSFGITYNNNFLEIFDIFNSLKNSSWQKFYEKYDIAFNLDWFFTYLKDKMKYKIESFYVENCYFIHWGNFIINPIGSSICHWHAGILAFPVLSEIYKDNDLGKIPVANDCIKFEINKTCDFGDFVYKYLSNIKHFPKELQNLHRVKKYGNHGKLNRYCR